MGFRTNFIALLLTIVSMTAHANIVNRITEDTRQIVSSDMDHPVYAGLMLGYGEPTWKQLADEGTDPGDTLTRESVPSYATGGGFAGGPFIGFQFSDRFTIELSYIKFRNTRMNFIPANFYGIGSEGLKSQTEIYNMIGKFMVPLGLTKAMAYASTGLTIIHRHDTIVNRGFATPNFGAGFFYDITPMFLMQWGFLFTVGDGKSNVRPVKYYVPFTYMIHTSIAYRL